MACQTGRLARQINRNVSSEASPGVPEGAGTDVVLSGRVPVQNMAALTKSRGPNYAFGPLECTLCGHCHF